MDMKPLPSTLKTTTLYASLFDRDAAEVTGIDIVDVLEMLWPGYWERGLYTKLSYDTTRSRIEAWCRDHDAHYYSRPRDSFDDCDAAAEAAAKGLSRVVLEDLS